MLLVTLEKYLKSLVWIEGWLVDEMTGVDEMNCNTRPILSFLRTSRKLLYIYQND